MDTLALFPLSPDQDPPAVAALYLSALDHERLYSASELRQAVSRAYAAVDQPSALLELYLRSVQASPTAAPDVRAARRSWALRMVRHLALDDGRPRAASAGQPAWAEPPVAHSEPAPRIRATSPSGPAGPAPSPTPAPTPGRTVTLRELRAARRRPALVTVAVVGAQMAGVVLANEAPGLMAVSWAGPLNVGLTLVLAQLVITGSAVLWYTRHARNSPKPVTAQHGSSPTSRLESHR
ncbi:DUF485 domain-containing protein [Streptomyces sp. NPDC057623]|uniref:DUF485 domain-containing protein n=1 Tax=Streptomyces sp. NPDC057623 TaxID=3346187 RepID=UPI003696A05A